MSSVGNYGYKIKSNVWQLIELSDVIFDKYVSMPGKKRQGVGQTFFVLDEADSNIDTRNGFNGIASVYHMLRVTYAKH